MSSRTPQPGLDCVARHAPARREPHVDSEEAVQYERRRVSRELRTLESSQRSSEARHTSHADASLRSRPASLQDSIASRQHLRRHTSDESTQSNSPSLSHDGRSSRTSLRIPHWYDPVAKFWNTHISITIDEGAHRDHLALERTFLGYLRTSLILVMTGVLIAQLFRLQHTENPNPDFGFYVIGRPLSVTFIGMALMVVLVGAFRFWKLQGGLVQGKAYTGGWEVLFVMGLSGLLLVGTFALVLGVNIDKATEGE